MPVRHSMIAGPVLAVVLASFDVGRPVGEPFELSRTMVPHRPFGIALSPCGVVYVTRLDADSVTHLDAESGNIVQSIAVGAIPTAVAFDRSGDQAFVANQYSASVSIIEVGTAAQRALIPVAGARPMVVASTSSTDLLLTGDSGNGIQITDLRTGSAVGTITVPHHANGLAIAHGDTLLYVSSISGSVQEIDLRTGRIGRQITVGGKPQEIVLSRNGRTLYIANEAGWVDAYDLARGRRIGHLRLRAGAFGMALGPDDRTLLVSLPSVGIVEVVNARRLAVEHSLTVGGRPRRIAISTVGDIAVVANEAGWVTFIR
jgi:YVTN family beta-propeller protein